jgi:hypothetical protein
MTQDGERRSAALLGAALIAGWLFASPSLVPHLVADPANSAKAHYAIVVPLISAAVGMQILLHPRL